jgi:hypothetical protein
MLQGILVYAGTHALRQHWGSTKSRQNAEHSTEACHSWISYYQPINLDNSPTKGTERCAYMFHRLRHGACLPCAVPRLMHVLKCASAHRNPWQCVPSKCGIFIIVLSFFDQISQTRPQVAILVIPAQYI